MVFSTFVADSDAQDHMMADDTLASQLLIRPHASTRLQNATLWSST